MSTRQLSPRSKWILRSYNELEHSFQKRVSQSFFFVDQYLESFPNYTIRPLAKLVVFLSGTLIAIILLISFFKDVGMVLSIQLFAGKTISWLLTILISIYAATHSIAFKREESLDRKELLDQIETIIGFDFRDSENSADSWSTKQKIEDCFHPLWQNLLLDLFGVLMNPLIFLIVLPAKAESIVNFVKSNSLEHPVLGEICSFSYFDVEDERKRPFGDQVQQQKFSKSISLFEKQQQSFVKQTVEKRRRNSDFGVLTEIEQNDNSLINCFDAISPDDFTSNTQTNPQNLDLQ